MNQKVALFALAITLVVGGCGPASMPERTGGPKAGYSAAAKRLTAVIGGNPAALNRKFRGVNTNVNGLFELAQLINSPLSSQDPQGFSQGLRSGFPQGVLAEAVPSVENGLWRLFPDGRMETVWKIRPNVLWHDGTPFTAEDLVFTARVDQYPGLAGAIGVVWGFVEGMEAADARTLVVRWKQAYVQADSMFDAPLPKHLLEKSLDELEPTAFAALPYFSEQIVGTGPFRLHEFVRDSHVTLRAYDQYVLGRPKVDELVVRFIVDPNTLSANLLAGEVELTLGNALSLDQALQLRDRWPDGRMVTHPIDNVVAIWPQLLDPKPVVIGEIRFRQALWHAINRQELVDVIQAGMATIAHGIVPPHAPEYADTESALVRYDYDPRRAAQLVEGLGYIKGPDGIFRDPSGERLTVELRTGGLQVAQKGLFPIRDRWQQVGVGVEPVVVPPQLYDEREYRITRPAFELSRQSATVDAIAQYHSRNVARPGTRWAGSNRVRYQNPEFDALSDQLLATIPRTERIDLLRRILHHMSDRAIILFQFYDVLPTLMSHRLSGVVTGTSVFNAHRWAVS